MTRRKHSDLAGLVTKAGCPAGGARAPELHIALTGGFDLDTVEIRLDGQPIFMRAGVTTASPNGLAESVETALRRPVSTVTVRVLSRDLASSVVVKGVGTTFLGISVESGRVCCRFSKRPFGYI
jgi:hypothetical protein